MEGGGSTRDDRRADRAQRCCQPPNVSAGADQFVPVPSPSLAAILSIASISKRTDRVGATAAMYRPDCDYLVWAAERGGNGRARVGSAAALLPPTGAV